MINTLKQKQIPTPIMYIAYFESPLGQLKITTDDNHLVQLDFVDEKVDPLTLNDVDSGDDSMGKTSAVIPPFAKGGITRQTISELEEYFAGQRQQFTVPVRFERGTEFQRDVWQELTKIPYGQTITYGEQARRIKRDKAMRAVGLTNGKNPIAIVVPCHRVIGANGKLTGYASGIWRKEWLLNHERNRH